MGALKSDASHRLFIVYGAVQQGCYLGVDFATAHVAVLGRFAVRLVSGMGRCRR